MSKSIAKPVTPASSRQRANARRVAMLPRQADLLETVKPVAATRALRKAAAAPVKIAKLQAAKAPVAVKQPVTSPAKAPVTTAAESPTAQVGLAAPLRESALPAPTVLPGIKAQPVAQAPVAEAKGAEVKVAANAIAVTRSEKPAPEVPAAKAQAVTAAAAQTSAAPVTVPAVAPKAKSLPKATGDAAPES